MEKEAKCDAIHWMNAEGFENVARVGVGDYFRGRRGQFWVPGYQTTAYPGGFGEEEL